MLLSFSSADFSKARNGEFNIRRRQDTLGDDAGYVRTLLGLLVDNPALKDYGLMMLKLLEDEETQPIAGWLAGRTYFFKEICNSALFEKE